MGHYATQNRAVTIQDYQSVCYGMPAHFGSIKRAAVSRDFDEFKRNLNIHVISEDTSGKLLTANTTLKNNLKNWILQYKMINDTVTILDAVIVNFGINYTVALDMNANRFSVINQANSALRASLLRSQYEVGESILITDFYKVLQKVNGVIDVIDMEIVGKTGASHAPSGYDFRENLSADGRRIEAENNIIFELKFPNIDIKGSVR